MLFCIDYNLDYTHIFQKVNTFLQKNSAAVKNCG